MRLIPILAMVVASMLCLSDPTSGQPRQAAPAGRGAAALPPTAAAPAGAAADFVVTTFTWSRERPEEKPELAVSGGITMAWIRDPDARLPENFANHHENGSKLIMAPGTPFIILPPRSATSELRGRGDNARFPLVITKDGFWGVIDLQAARRENAILSESDLRAYFRAARRANRAAIAVVTTTISIKPFADTNATVGATRGEVVRVHDGEPGKRNPTLVAYDLDHPAHAAKRQKIANEFREKKVTGNRVPPTLPLEGIRLAPISEEVLPAAQRDAWIDQDAAPLSYEAMFRQSFHDIRLVRRAEVRLECDTSVVVKEADETKQTTGLKAGASVDLGFWDFLKLIASGSYEATANRTVTRETIRQGEVTRYDTVWPFRLRRPGEVATQDFAVGQSRLCKRAAHSTFFLMSEEQQAPIFLHGELQSLSADGGPIPGSHATEPLLEKIKPRPPLSMTFEGVRFACYEQYLELVDLLETRRFASPPFERPMVVALLGARGSLDRGVTLRDFFLPCASRPGS